MITKELYNIDYYAARSMLRKIEFIDWINQDEALNDLITPSLVMLKDRLFKVINGEMVDSIEFTIPHEIEMNAAIAIKFMEERRFTMIDDKVISENLFTNVLRRLINNIFGRDKYNDEKYVVQTYLHNWLESKLAQIICKDDRFSKMDIVLKLINQTWALHHFYGEFEKYIPDKWISENPTEWISLGRSPRTILENISTFDRGYFMGYDETLSKAKELRLVEFINEATHYSGYAGFNEDISLKSTVLFNRRLDLWVLFWDGLELPVLQDVVFHYFRNPLDILTIAETLVENKANISNLSNLSVILLKNSFDLCLKTAETLSFYINEERLNHLTQFEKDDALIAKGKEAREEWLSDKESYYERLFAILSVILTVKDIEDWVFSNKRRSLPKNSYTDNYNSEIDSIFFAYKNFTKGMSFESKLKGIEQAFNLEKFNFIVDQIKDGATISKQECKHLLGILISHCMSDDFYWDKTYSPAYWEAMKGVGILLSRTGAVQSEVMNIINNIKVSHEGWIVDIDFKRANAESFLLCGICMVLEHKNSFDNKNDRTLFFRFLLDWIILQSRFSRRDVNADYVMPLHILYLVVNQIDKSLKTYFEGELIKGMDNLYIVLTILVSEKFKLQPISKKLLKKRLAVEVQYVKRELIRRKDNTTPEVLDEWIKKLEVP